MYDDLLTRCDAIISALCALDIFIIADDDARLLNFGHSILDTISNTAHL